jgi:dihydrofolate reductase
MIETEEERREAVRNASFLIAAVAIDGVIGSEGRIPWRHREDMRHFRNATLGCAVVIGRRTFDTLPSQLPGRTLVVVTSRPMPEGSTALAASRLDEAIETAMRAGVPAIAFAGGTRIYEEALDLPWLRKAFVTRMDILVDGDARFPRISPDWRHEAEMPLPSMEGEPAATVETLVLRPSIDMR